MAYKGLNLEKIYAMVSRGERLTKAQRNEIDLDYARDCRDLAKQEQSKIDAEMAPKILNNPTLMHYCPSSVGNGMFQNSYNEGGFYSLVEQ